MKHLLVFALFTVAFASLALADDVAITVYNQNLALVKEGRSLEFPERRQPHESDRRRLLYRSHLGALQAEIRRRQDRVAWSRTIQYDLVSSEKILQKYLGNDIDVIMKNGDVLKGKYLSSSSGYLVLQLPEGAIRLINDKEMLSVTAPKLPEGLIVVPTLQWLLSSDVSGKRDVEVSYLTGNINWHAEYIALLDATDTKLQLSGWVSLDNQSGKTYRDAKLKLVAGDINRVQPPQQPMYGKGDGDGHGIGGKGFRRKGLFRISHVHPRPSIDHC